MENFTSVPFSNRESGSAFMSQYCRPAAEGESVAVSAALAAGRAVFDFGFFRGSAYNSRETCDENAAPHKNTDVPDVGPTRTWAPVAASFLSADVFAAGVFFSAVWAAEGLWRVDRRGATASPSSTALDFRFGIMDDIPRRVEEKDYEEAPRNLASSSEVLNRAVSRQTRRDGEMALWHGWR